MYAVILYIHSWLRWLLLVLCIIVIARSVYGWISKRDYLKSDSGLAASLTGLFHIQLLIGLLLYFVLSPITETVLTEFGNSMKDPMLRFWGVEHILVMILAVISAQIGRTLAKKADKSVIKFRTQTIYYGLAFILVISRIPWTDTQRLFRGITE